MAIIYILIGVLLTLGIEFVAFIGLAVYFSFKTKIHK